MLLMRHFKKYYIDYLLSYIIGISVLIFIDYLQLFIPQYVGEIIDVLEGNQNLEIVFNLITSIVLIALVVTAGRFIWRYTIFGASRNIQFDLMNKMFRHSTELQQDFYSKQKVGAMMALYTNDLEAVRKIYGPGILLIFDAITLGSFALFRMFSLNSNLTLFVIFPLMFLSFVSYFIIKKMRKRFKIRQKSFEELSDFTQENFSGWSVIKAFVKEISQSSFFRKKSEKLYSKTISYVKINIFFEIIIRLIENIIIMFVIIYGSINVISFSDGLTPGELAQYLAYFFTLLWPTFALARFFSIQSQAKASAARISEFLDSAVTVKDPENIVIKNLSGNIELKNLSFKYPDGDKNVLDNVSFKINKGEMVGILGKTGSGKSSLVDLFLRTYNVNEKQLFIDGIDIMELSIKNVRNLMGYVPQDNFLFSETVSYNIAFGLDKNYSDQIVIDSSKLADVHDNIINFKEKYDTVLGERGVTISGGQKQRISIARALAKDPEILILDDSVSSVDTKTEEAIINNLQKIRKNRTTIFIAHRISTVKNMDRIILMDKGKVVAMDKHENLLKSSELYREMVKKQKLEEMNI
jgi:ATP-binding cassette subfamily B protein